MSDIAVSSAWEHAPQDIGAVNLLVLLRLCANTMTPEGHGLMSVSTAAKEVHESEQVVLNSVDYLASRGIIDLKIGDNKKSWPYPEYVTFKLNDVADWQ